MSLCTLCHSVLIVHHCTANTREYTLGRQTCHLASLQLSCSGELSLCYPFLFQLVCDDVFHLSQTASRPALSLQFLPGVCFPRSAGISHMVEYQVSSLAGVGEMRVIVYH